MARLRILSAIFGLGALALAAPATAQDFAGLTLRGADPYEPVGVGVGRFTLYPAIEIGGTFTGGTIGTPGAALSVSPELAIVLNGSPHDFRLTLDAEIVPVATYQAALVAAVDARVTLSLDLPSLWRLDLDAFFGLAEQAALDPLLPAGVDAAPHVHTAGGRATLEGPVGPLALRLSFGVERGVFEDGIDSGVVVDQGDRDFTRFEGTARVATDGGGRLTPFAEATAGRRIHDRPIGMDGFLQAGNFATLRAGVAYNSAPVMTAEIALGYHWEIPDDPGLQGLRGLTIDVNSTWSPRELLVFTFTALTSFRPDPSLLSGGSVRQDFTLRGEIDARENLTIGATGQYGIEVFGGGVTERTAIVGADVVWNLSRSLQLTAGITNQRLWSPDPSRNGTTTTLELTARVLR